MLERNFSPRDALYCSVIMAFWDAIFSLLMNFLAAFLTGWVEGVPTNISKACSIDCCEELFESPAVQLITFFPWLWGRKFILGRVLKHTYKRFAFKEEAKNCSWKETLIFVTLVGIWNVVAPNLGQICGTYILLYFCLRYKAPTVIQKQ